MLKAVYVQNFRTCQSVELTNFSTLMVLVGRNGVGKTNVLKAIEWAARLGSSSPVPEDNTLEPKQYSVTLEVELDRSIYSYTAGTVFVDSSSESPNTRRIELSESLIVKSDPIPTRILWRQGKNVSFLDSATPGSMVEVEIAPQIPAIPALRTLYPKSHYFEFLTRLSSFLDGIKYYALEESAPAEKGGGHSFVSEAEYKAWLEGKNVKQTSTRVVLLKLLNLYLEQHEKFTELSQLAGPAGLGIVRDISCVDFDIPVGENQDAGAPTKTVKYYFFRFTPAHHRENSQFNFDGLSFGTKRVLRLMISLLYDESSVALVEQPEDGIHRGLLHKLIPLLRDNESAGQFVLTTHSAEVLNRIDPREVRLVEIHDGVSTVRPLTEKEVTAASEYLANEGEFSDFVDSIED
jgi:AAA domain, putative AbiEii toxin, Type IV TA system